MIAIYNGWCAECGQPIKAGVDEIEHMPSGDFLDGWRHAVCPEQPEMAHARAGEVHCPKCFLIHPEGTCDLDA